MSCDQGADITLVELVMDVCANTHGQGACGASGDPCFNTWYTCQRQACDEYECATRSYWFSTCQVNPALAISSLPIIESVSHDPVTIEPGVTFSTRGKIDITLRDMQHTDAGFDPYFPRGVIPICPADMPGTVLARLIARNRWFDNRRINVYQGTTAQPLCDMDKYAYIVTRFAHGGDSRKVSITAKDPLTITDGARLPDLTNIFINADTGSATRLSLGRALDGDDGRPYRHVNRNILPFSVSDESSGVISRIRYVSVGSEVLSVKPVREDGVWGIVLLDRAVCNTDISDHKIGAEIEALAHFSGHVADIICQILSQSDIAAVAATCCDDDAPIIDWDSLADYKCARPLDLVPHDVVFAGSTTAKSMLDSLAESFLLSVYYDDGLVRFLPISPPEEVPESEFPYTCKFAGQSIDECEILEGSFNIQSSTEPVSVVRINHTPDGCRGSDYLASTVSVNGDTVRDPCERREGISRNTKSISSRWISGENSYIARSTADRWLRMLRYPSERITITVRRDKAREINIGTWVQLYHTQFQNEFGGWRDEPLFVRGKSRDGRMVKIHLSSMNMQGMAQNLTCNQACSPSIDHDPCQHECYPVW